MRIQKQNKCIHTYIYIYMKIACIYMYIFVPLERVEGGFIRQTYRETCSIQQLLRSVLDDHVW